MENLNEFNDQIIPIYPNLTLEKLKEVIEKIFNIPREPQWDIAKIMQYQSPEVQEAFHEAILNMNPKYNISKEEEDFLRKQEEKLWFDIIPTSYKPLKEGSNKIISSINNKPKRGSNNIPKKKKRKK